MESIFIKIRIKKEHKRENDQSVDWMIDRAQKDTYIDTETSSTFILDLSFSILAAASVFELILMLSKKNKTYFTIDASCSKTALGIRFFWLWSNYITHTHAHNKTLYHGSCRWRQETKRAQREFLKKKGETGYKGENNGGVFSSY